MSSEIREAQNLYEAVGIALDKAQTKEDQEVRQRPTDYTIHI
jgi:hypothetical protein